MGKHVKPSYEEMLDCAIGVEAKGGCVLSPLSSLRARH